MKPGRGRRGAGRPGNSPQRAPLGLYAEQISGTAFTQPRAVNRRTWVYRVLPVRPASRRSRWIGNGLLRSAPFREVEPDPNRMRWDPPDMQAAGTDFVDGLYTIGGNGDALSHAGIGIHWYTASASMVDRYSVDADGELLIVPESRSQLPRIELGLRHLAPGEFAVIPRGIRFRVEPPRMRSHAGRSARTRA